MGRFILTTVNMKSLLFACLVALAIAELEAKADAEADPWLYYSNHYNYAPSVYSGYRPYQGYNNYRYAYGAYGSLYGRKKREAAADADADPYLLYAHHGVLPYHYPYQPVVYSTVNKVEDSNAADTEAAEPVNHVVPVTFNYPYTHPAVYNAHPTVYNTHPSVYSYSPFLHSVVPSVATKKVVKREAEPAAEAEADPWYAYSSYYRPHAGYHPYAGYSGYGYSGYRPYGHFGRFGYGYGK